MVPAASQPEQLSTDSEEAVVSLHQSVVFPWLGLCAAVAVITPNALVLTALNMYAPDAESDQRPGHG